MHLLWLNHHERFQHAVLHHHHAHLGFRQQFLRPDLQLLSDRQCRLIRQQPEQDAGALAAFLATVQADGLKVIRIKQAAATLIGLVVFPAANDATNL